MLEAKRFLIYTLAQDLQLLSVCGVVSSLHFNVEDQCVCVCARVCVLGSKDRFSLWDTTIPFQILHPESVLFKGFCSEKQL